MKIVIVSAYYSEGMGYSENSLPKALAKLGHEVHVVTSELNVYGNEEGYRNTYESFLGPAHQEIGSFESVGYKVHRLRSTIIFGYVYIKGMYDKIKQLSPDIVQVTEIASLNAFKLASIQPFLGFKLFAETHQHLSVVKAYIKNPQGDFWKKRIYEITRTFPTYLASRFIDRCYAIAPDCIEVANKFYGLPLSKIQLQPLGTDTILFSPVDSETASKRCELIRRSLGYKEDDIVCIYTGRFSEDKDPLLLAKAIDSLAGEGLNFYGLFIGEGVQRERIMSCKNIQTIEFMKHVELADYYRAADIGVWPKQESMSMLDGASCGLPLVVSNRIGEIERVLGNGKVYEEGNLDDLIIILKSLINKSDRKSLGITGAKKMEKRYSWINVARNIEKDYLGYLKKDVF